jgi:prophage regulatory protein
MPERTKKMNDRIVRLPAVKEVSGLCRSSIYEGVAAGTFPAPVKIGLRAVGWRSSDLTNWLETRVSRLGKKS